MDILYATYPLSLGFILTIFTFGVILTSLTFGLLSSAILLLCIYGGIIRMAPIFKGIAHCINTLNPGLLERAKENIYKSFIVEYPYGVLPKTPHIFTFHPHGVFSIANMLHIGTDFTEWSHKPIKGTVSDKIAYFPMGEEIIELGNFVVSNYESMKSVIDDDNSLTVCMGGVREVLYIQPNKLSLTILKKQGIFRLAIETGKPLVPVITYGENELIDPLDTPLISSIQKKIVPYGMAVLIPTIESYKRWYNILREPLKEPIRTVIGKPIDVGTPRKATYEEIVELREKYFTELRELYKKTKPESYDDEIYIV